MERYLILERLGWKLIRMRASEFYRDPETVVKRLLRRLQGLGIDRGGQGDRLRERGREEQDGA